jgi:hypothetical protein
MRPEPRRSSPPVVGAIGHARTRRRPVPDLLPGAHAAPADPGAVPVDPATERPVDAPGAKRPYSDEVIRPNTGRTWDDWFALLDAWGAAERPHAEIARWVVEEHGVGGWWAQGVTVAYEQARGLRAPGQRRGGLFEVNASKTVAVPVDRLYEAFADPALRERWLPDAGTADRLKRYWRERMAALKQVLEA